MRLTAIALRRAWLALVGVGSVMGYAPIASADVFFSEYVEGSSNNKALEIYNSGTSAVDLTAGKYVIQNFANGAAAAAPTSTTALTGTLAAGATAVFCNGASNAAILAVCPAANRSGNFSFNGDDAQVLKVGGESGTVLDVIGQVGTDPGTRWGTPPTSTLDNTIRRKSTLCTGDTNGADAFDPAVQWDGFAIDTVNGLGMHTADCGAPTGTSFRINDVMMAEGNSGMTNFIFTVTKTGPDAANVMVATSDGTATVAGMDYTATMMPLMFAAGDTTKTFTVPVMGDTAVEGNETFTVTLSMPSNGATLSDATATGTISNDDAAGGMACGDTATLISTVQGSGAATTLTGSVQIEGIVIGDFQGANSLKGFFVQEEDGQDDGNPATSEGIFVFEDTATPANVSVGDRVRVMGMATERMTTANGQTSNLTAIGGPTTTLCAGAQPLPALIDVTLPFGALTAAERFEGMRVRLPQNLFVTDNFTLGRFGEVVLSSGNRLVNPTQNNLPGTAANNAQAANNLNKITLDDGNSQQNRDPIAYPGSGLTAMNTLRGGDRVMNLTGVLSDEFGTYRIQPTAAVNFTADNMREAMPPLPGAAGSFRVASFNVLNYFNGDGTGGGFPTSRGANSAAEFTRQRNKIIPAILALKADVVGLIEIENDDFSGTSAIADLVNGLNAAAPGGTTYAFVNPGVAKIGTDEIKVSFIYRTETTDLVGAARILDSNTANTPTFNSSRNRAVLAQTFKQKSSTLRFTAAVNHFKSKGSACSEDADAGDGQGNCAQVRNQAAQALLNWLGTDPTGSGDPDYLILGDLNAYAREDAIRTLEAAGYVNLAQRDHGTEPVLSYPFDDQWGTLDYALANASLAPQVTKAVEWTINGAEPISLDYNVEFKTANQQNTLYNPDAFRSSDHDPVVIEMAACNAGALSFKNSPYTVLEGNTLTVTVQRTGGTCGTVGLSYATGAATGSNLATSNTDFTATSGTLSFADGETEKSFTVATTADAIDEADEVFGLGLSNATGGAVFASGMATEATTATITDNNAVRVRFAVANSTAGEGAGMTTVQLELVGGTSSRDVLIPLTFMGNATRGTMMGQGDYQTTGGLDGMDRATITAGNTSTTVTFTLNDDTLDEVDEVINLAIGSGVMNADAPMAGEGAHALTISDNDNAPTVSFAAAMSSFPETAATRTVTITLSAASSRDVTVPFTVSGTATGGGSDYTLTTTSPLTIAAGATTATISLDVVDDTLEEAAETVVFSLGSPTNATAAEPTSHMLTIEANDAPAQDVAPDAFSFQERTNLQPGAAASSELVTITGFTGTLMVTVSNGGQCSIIRQGETTGSPFADTCTIAPGDRLMVSHVTANEPGTAKESVVTIGSTTAIFRTNTGNEDRIPDAFGWTMQNNVAPGMVVESEAITLTGYNASAVIERPQTGVEYRIGTGAWMSVRGSLPVGATLQIRHTTNTGSRAYTISRLRVGGVDGSFTTRNRK